MLAAIGVTLAGSLLSGLPVLRAETGGRAAQTADVLGGLAIRLFFVLAATLYLVLNEFVVERMPFLLWVVVSYLVLLPADIRYALRSRPPKAPPAE